MNSRKDTDRQQVMLARQLSERYRNDKQNRSNMQIGRIFEKNETEQKLYNVIQECDSEKKLLKGYSVYRKKMTQNDQNRETQSKN